jgi:hypothetical protein
LYVAEIGVATAVGGAADIYGEAWAGSRRGIVRLSVAIVAVAYAATTLVAMVRAQDVFADGSDKVLEGDQRAWESREMRPYIVPSHLEGIERRLVDSGRIDPP